MALVGRVNQPAFFMDEGSFRSAAEFAFITRSSYQRALFGAKSGDKPAARATRVQPPESLLEQWVESISQCVWKRNREKRVAFYLSGNV